MVPVVICFITNQYLKSPICNVEIEKTFNEEKMVVLALLEKLTEENENYFKNLKKKCNLNLKLFEFDFINVHDKLNWKNSIVQMIDKYFQKKEEIVNLNLKVVKLLSGTTIFKQVNRLCLISEIIIVGDYELGVGIHVFDLNPEYLFTYNHNAKLKKVTGLCKIDDKKFGVVSSLPNTTEHDIFIFKYSSKTNAIKESYSFNNSDQNRDLCGIEYNPIDCNVYVVDRLNCSILKFDKNLESLAEIRLQPMLPRRFNTPILRDIKFNNDYFFLTDSFSAKNHRGNDCIHIFQFNTLTWVKTIGESILNSPVSLSINVDGTEIAVLERSSEGLIKYFKLSGEISRITHLSESRYPTNFIEPDNNFIIVNDQKNNISIYGLETIKSEICNIC
jgi:hypothetical protein